MLEKVTTNQPNFTSVDAVNDLLRIDPKLTEYRDMLLILFNQAWRGEWPFEFYQSIKWLHFKQPWFRLTLQNQTGLSFMPELKTNELFYVHGRESHELWEKRSKQISTRRHTWFFAFESLLLASKLHFGPEENECAHRLMGRVLDQIDSGLKSRASDNVLRNRKHPLKDILKKVGKPQTIEKLWHALKEILPEVNLMYPRLGEFIQDAILPLASNTPSIWKSPIDYREDDVLDTDKPPQSTYSDNANLKDLVTNPDMAIKAISPEIVERAFSIDDLVNEIINYDPALFPHKDALVAISKAWRGEFTICFFGAVGDITLRSPWLGPLIQNSVAKPVLVALRKAKSNNDWNHNFARKSKEWRERQYLEPLPEKWIRASFEPYKPEHGLNLLKGLMFLGRFLWEPSENKQAQDAIDKLVESIEFSKYENKYTREEERVATSHPLIEVLDTVDAVKTPEQVALALEQILQVIATFDNDAATLIRHAYFPILKIPQTKPINKDTNTDKEKSKTCRRKRPYRSESEDRRQRISLRSRQAPLVGESLEETEPTICLLRRSKPSEKPISLKSEIRWAHQRIYSNNQLLLRNHIECLSDAEAYLFVKALNAKIDLAIINNDSKIGWLCIVLALTLITGWSIRTWIDLEIFINASGKYPKGKPLLILEDGYIRLPVIRPEGAFTPNASMRSKLVSVSQTVDLHLPPTIRTWINRLNEIEKPNWSSNEQELRHSLDELVSDLDSGVGTGISLSRVRLVARARILQVTNDLASTMILCGDTFGQSTASLYYTNVNTAELEQKYQIASWPLFNDQTVPLISSNQTNRIGSELLVTAEGAHALAWGMTNTQKSANSKCKSSNQHIDKHNGLVDHILKMILAISGHRPTSALFELTRFDFDVVKHAAVYKDKQCDAAHMYRFLPTPDTLSIQLEKYFVHLRSIIELYSNNRILVDQVSSALDGTGPLFFHICPQFLPFTLQLASWKNTLPSTWQDLPLNWGRTWLASRGREAGIKAEHLSIMLGHLDAAGYPFSNESPLEPAQLSRAISSPLGELARSSGWVIRNGMKTNSSKNSKLLELGPLKNWNNERKKLSVLAKEYAVEQRQILRSTLQANRLDGEKIALESIEFVLKQPIINFDQLLALESNHKVKTTSSILEIKDEAVLLTEEDLENIQNKIDEITEKNKVLSIAAHNALHRYLKHAKQKNNWNCPIPSPWLSSANMEPTPFFPGIFRATTQLHELRQHFGRIPVKAPSDTSYTSFEWSCGKTIIALCIFGFIDSESQIIDILNGRQSAIRSSTFKDLLLVEAGEDKHVIGVRGIAALALASLKYSYQGVDLPNMNRLNLVIAHQIPAALSGNSYDVLSRLCSTVSVTNIVELSGLARNSLQPGSGCVAMSASRQRQMFEDGYGVPDGNSIGSSIDRCNDVDIAFQLSKSSNGKSQYKKLRDTIYIGEGPKKFKITGECLTQANIGAFRKPLCRELTEFLKMDDLNPLVALIAGFALKLTAHGTQNKKNLAWSTVYSYITSFGFDLVDNASDVDFPNLEPEEFIDLYQDVIDCKTSGKTRWLAARELVNFHRYLQEHHGFEVVDFSDLEGLGERPEIQVDAEVIQPREFAHGLERLSLNATNYELIETSKSDSLRTNRQSEVYALLSRYSKARHNELTALRFKDILANTDSVILFIRPSRYRRLKTQSARRMVDISNGTTAQQRSTIADWINAEKVRLGSSWKPTLPIFGLLAAPKDRVSSAVLRDAVLSALEESVGYRTKVHRSRHLGACEDNLAIFLSDVDLNAIINASTTINIPNQGALRPKVLLPRHIRQLSNDMGHRRILTTIINYFHIPWALTSRAHQLTLDYLDRHVASVALGTGYSNVFKIAYRSTTKSGSANDINSESLDAWLTYLVDKPTPTPGKSISPISIERKYSSASPLRGRDVEHILRDIQRDIPQNEVCLAHGITLEQLHRLKMITNALQIKIGFSIWTNKNRRQRSARVFQETIPLQGILDIIDRDKSDADRQLVVSVSHSYLLWSWKSVRDKFTLPSYEADRLSQLLLILGLSSNQIIVTSSHKRSEFKSVTILRSGISNQHLNHSIAWYLVVAYIVDAFNES